MSNKDRAIMIYEISEISFYIDDLRLFLDTHPNNTQALAMYNEFVMKRLVLIEEYVETYGPINSYSLNTDNSWKWVSYPWPWEGVC